jgi:hypothetical protein
VQPVDVLGDHSGESGGFQIGECPMSRVGMRTTDSTPAEMGTGPVSPLRICRADELAVLHRGGADRGWTPIVRNPRISRHACAGERDPTATAEQVRDRCRRDRRRNAHTQTVPTDPLTQLIVPAPLSRRAASAIEPVIEG